MENVKDVGDAMPVTQTRRRLIAAPSAVSIAGFLRSPSPSAAEEVSETTAVRFGKDPSICVAPMDVSDELLRAEGFTDIRYVDMAAFTLTPGFDPIGFAMVQGECDFGLNSPVLYIPTIEAGALVAGVIGTHKFVYDICGDTVNTAKRMETYGVPGRIHVSAVTRQSLGDAFRFEPGAREIKGKGLMEKFFLDRR